MVAIVKQTEIVTRDENKQVIYLQKQQQEFQEISDASHTQPKQPTRKGAQVQRAPRSASRTGGGEQQSCPTAPLTPHRLGRTLDFKRNHKMKKLFSTFPYFKKMS